MMASDSSTGLTFWSTPQVADMLGVPRSTVEVWRSRGIGPKFIRAGKHVRYESVDVLAWIEENKHDRRW